MGIKLICGWLVGLLYLHYYQGGDTWNYYSDGVALAKLFSESWKSYFLSWVDSSYYPASLIYQNQPRAVLMSHLVSIGCIFTQNNYWLISTYFSIISFAGLWYLGDVLIQHFPATKLAVAISLFSYPSFAFWSAGILKETLAVALISVIVAWSLQFYFFDKHPQQHLVKFLGWMGAALLLWMLKYYYAAVLIPVLLSLILAKRLPGDDRFLLVKALSIFGFLLLTASFLHPNLKLDRFIEVMVKNHDTFLRISEPANVIHFYNLLPTWESLLVNAPQAWFSGWYRPLLGETKNLLQHLAGLENLVVLGISFFTISHMRQIKDIPRHHVAWILAGAVYALLLGLLLAFSTPNFGTLMRYKVVFSPFLVYFSLIFVLWKLRSGSHVDRYIR